MSDLSAGTGYYYAYPHGENHPGVAADKIHLVLGGLPFCGSRVPPHYAFCASGFHHEIVTCKRCKAKWAKVSAKP